MSGNAAAAEILTLTANGNGTGIPPDILSALIDSHVSRLQGDLCMILLSGICYGVTLQYVVAYFTHYWRGRPESGIRRDSLGMRVYVVVLCTVATAYLCVIIASAWGHGTLSVMYAGIVDPDPTALQVVDWWLLCALFILLNGYWVFARCYKVTKSALLRILGAVLFGASAASLIAVAILYLKLKLDSTISFDDLDICVAVGLWLALALDIFCALVLCYELVYKRRKSLAKSSLVQQFLVVALQSSLLTAVAHVPGAVAIAYHIASADSDALVATITASKLYVYTSFGCVLYTLVSRASFSTTDPTLPAFDSAKLHPCTAVVDPRSASPATATAEKSDSSSGDTGGWGGHVGRAVSRALLVPVPASASGSEGWKGEREKTRETHLEEGQVRVSLRRDGEGGEEWRQVEMGEERERASS